MLSSETVNPFQTQIIFIKKPRSHIGDIDVISYMKDSSNNNWSGMDLVGRGAPQPDQILSNFLQDFFYFFQNFVHFFPIFSSGPPQKNPRSTPAIGPNSRIDDNVDKSETVNSSCFFVHRKV